MPPETDASAPPHLSGELVGSVLREAFKPAPKEKIWEWAGRCITLDPTSPLKGSYRIEESLYVRDPMEAFQDESVRHIVMIGPNQGGRTKAMEVMSVWALIHRAGPSQWNTDIDDKSSNFAEDRWWPTAKSCSEFCELLPTAANKKRTEKVFLTNGSTFTMQGSSESNLQQDSILNQFNDEGYKWKVGRMQQAWNRCDVSYAASHKIVDGSVAGDEGGDLHAAWEYSSQGEWSFACRACGRVQPFAWAGVRFESEKFPNGEHDYKRAALTTRYECQCGEVYPDSPVSRKQMNRSARYVHAHPDRKIRGFRFNCLAVNWPGITWGKWVAEFLRAQDALRVYGNMEPLKAFWSRRMAEFWDDRRHTAKKTAERPADLVSYPMGAMWASQKWGADEHGPEEAARYMTVDKQTWGYPTLIRAVKPGGASRLLWHGILNTYAEIAAKADEYGVLRNFIAQADGWPSSRVIIDCGWGEYQDDVFAACVEHGFIAMKGSDLTGFPHRMKRDGQTVVELRPYSEAKWGDPAIGKKEAERGGFVRQRVVRYFEFSNLRIKDTLDRIRRGETPIYWGVPGDVSDVYWKEMNAEVRFDRVIQRGRSTAWWSNSNAKGTGSKRPNHAWDLECMMLTAFILEGWMTGPAISQTAEAEESAA